MTFLKLLKAQSSHILIPYIHLVIKNSHHLLSNTSLIMALLSLSLPHPRSLESVVFKSQCAIDLPAEPGKTLKGPPPPERFWFSREGQRTKKLKHYYWRIWGLPTWAAPGASWLGLVWPISPPIPPFAEKMQSKVQSPHCFVAWALPISSPIACISDPKPQQYSLQLVLPHPRPPSNSSWRLLLFLSPAQTYFHYKLFPDISRKGNYSLQHSTCSLYLPYCHCPDRDHGWSHSVSQHKL